MKMPKVFCEGMGILLSVIIINIEHQSVCFTRIWDFTWRFSVSEELSGDFTWSCL